MGSAKRSVHRRAGEGSLSGATPEELPGTPPLLHVLLLEDSAADADLLVYELRKGGYEPVARRVENREAMLDALKDGSWEIVFLDYALKGGETAMEALASLAELDIDLPAILISGMIGEEEAADALRAGACDFVNKGNLTRLVPAVARELAQVEVRRQKKEGEEAFRQSEQRLRLALAAGGMGSWEWDLESGRLSWSETVEAMFGLEPGTFGGTYAEFMGLSIPTTATSSGRASSRRSSMVRLRSSTEPCGGTGRSAGTSASRSAFETQTASSGGWWGSRST